ncbi:calmodulin-regulated spectrin-associated protein 1-B-like isoform X2 [Brienomyrus brachyistius]|uniref:calmodulin-regulated spectrin-associated protein 1-B-like isoform X2 n=1 Tax=Brienomyrus brachyistius TaxID=42636 RepID=UPI0020B247DD|nr:calmodulin-regulated spectrin-associated protein 1-B-like isoform X2 [Brienomyrus brachyistius]
MDVDADGTRRKTDPRAEAAVEVVALELYDSARAKIDANLRWLFAKAYGIEHIPEELRDPFYTDQYEQEHIKPPVIRLLLSGELYCRVCALILKGDQAASLQSHQSVVQVLSRKGIYVMESDDSPVSESDLGCAPIKMSAHIAMIDALMMSYTVEMISIEKVVASVKRFSTFSASKELPFDLEDAMVFWINKVNLKMREITEKELKLKQHLLESPSHQKSPSKWYWKLVPVRYRRDHLSGRQLPYFPLLEDLMKDGCDCAALLAVVHYYCPDHMKLDDICLKEVTSIADSLYNIQLLKEFANEYLNKGFYLTIEDMLYAPLVLKQNVMVFVAELFWWFEVVKPDFVQPRDLQEIKDARAILQPKGTRHPVPISNATKRSFLVSPGAPDTVQHTEASSSKGSPALGNSHPLLPLRQRQQKSLQGEAASDMRNRSNSLTRVDGHPRGSVMAWTEKKQRPLSQPTPYATDSDADLASGDSVSLARSISKDSLASNVLNVTPSHQLGGPVFHLGPRGISGHSLLGHVNVRDDEEEEELVAIIKSEKGLDAGCDPSRENLDLQNVSSRTSSARSPRRRPQEIPIEPQPDSFYLEPLMPAVLKPAKEKSINLNKEEECGEVRSRSSSRRGTEGPTPSTRRKVPSSGSNHDLNHTFTPISSTEFLPEPKELPTEGGSGAFKPDVISSMDLSSRGQSCGFFLHASDKDDSTPLAGQVRTSPFSNSLAWEISKDSESEEEEQDTELFLARQKCLDRAEGEAEEEESLKLQEDMKVREHEDKDGASGRSSPCLSTISQASSIASSSARMTSFAERRQMKGGGHDARSSTSSSQKTTPDGSESFQLPLTTWRQKREQSPTLQGRDGANLLASELVQLHMQLEEKRRAIEMQKKKMESLSARQRLKLGKAAFLNIVKKGKSDTLPQPLKSDHYSKEDQKVNGEKEVSSKDDSCVEALRGKARERNGQEGKAKVRWAMESPTSPSSLEIDNKINSALLLEDGSTEPDLNECNRSIEMLNEAISAIQQQMMQLSLQQDLLMKQNVQSPTAAPLAPPPGPALSPGPTPTGTFANGKSNVVEPKIRPAVHFVEPISSSGSTVVRKPPKLSSGRGPRSKPTELKLPKESGKQAMRIITPTQSVETLPHLRQFSGGRTPKGESEGSISASTAPVEAAASLERGVIRNMTFRLNDEANQRTAIPREPSNIEECLFSSLKERELNSSDGSGKENVSSEEVSKNKSHLIEVDLSDLKDPEDTGSDIRDVTADISDGDQKSVLGFFFKDEQKAEDEMAKKRAAFLLKQQRKAEEARIRKQQLELESEQKRDESRRKAEEDRIRKEEEKARRELIKQEYLRRKQQEMIEEQGLAKPKSKPKKQRPKSVHRGESSSDTYSKCSSTPDNLSSAQSGSSLSLASAATTEAESVNSGGAGSQRGDSIDSFPVLSRNASRNTERDWDNGSTASSITSVAEYSGPKLFKEPSAKSNKPIIHNAIAHCCLAGKVNEPQKNSILEELEKCESNHLMILFRDGGCQFRALYSFFPDTEEILKLTGTGPKCISKKMIDKLYKYSSDRKQFTVIPAKTVSVSVDALTIHNHLWQVKRPVLSKKSVK